MAGGFSDATSGEQFYQVEDLLNNVNRLSIGQYNNGQIEHQQPDGDQCGGNGRVCTERIEQRGNGRSNVFGSGGASAATVATIDNAGNAQFNGTLQVGGTAQSSGTMTVRNNVDAEVDYYLWPGLTASQKGSFTYKDWNGNSQWYMVKDRAITGHLTRRWEDWTALRLTKAQTAATHTLMRVTRRGISG